MLNISHRVPANAAPVIQSRKPSFRNVVHLTWKVISDDWSSGANVINLEACERVNKKVQISRAPDVVDIAKDLCNPTATRSFFVLSHKTNLTPPRPPK